MGLAIGVGWLARDARSADMTDMAPLTEAFETLNGLLTDRGMPLHREPLDIPDDDIVEFEMLGYSGLHAVRRLAAHHEYLGRLPPPCPLDEAAQDPILAKLDRRYAKWLEKPEGIGFWPFRRQVPAPRFMHLLWHSDAEGFYIPQDFPLVIFDNAEPQRWSSAAWSVLRSACCKNAPSLRN